MRVKTFVIAIGPAVLLMAAKTAIEPEWIKAWSFPACLALGVAVGGFGAVAAGIIEPHD